MTQNREPPAYQEYAATMLANKNFRLMSLEERGLFFTMRKHLLLVRWIAKQSKNLRAGKPYATREEFMLKVASLGFDPAEFADL
ncbi:MAG: hypothetical protein PHU06_08275 [Gallionella sp.]|nr:hypothetical protein [Gallionella sp.]MDD4958963.1 hypothetical protein [Gallionella sp.]